MTAKVRQEAVEMVSSIIDEMELTLPQVEDAVDHTAELLEKTFH